MFASLHELRGSDKQSSARQPNSFAGVRLRTISVWAGLVVMLLTGTTLVAGQPIGSYANDRARLQSRPQRPSSFSPQRGYRPWTIPNEEIPQNSERESGADAADSDDYEHGRGRNYRPVERDEQDEPASLSRGIRRRPELQSDTPQTDRLERPVLQIEQTEGRTRDNVREREPAREGIPGLVADDGGPVAELLIHYAVNSEGELGPVFRDLFQSLRPDMRLQVCCSNEDSVKAFVQRWGTAAVGPGRDVHVINVNRPITVWARDRRIFRQTADGHPAATFIPSAHTTYDSEKQNDLLVQSLLWSTGLVPGIALPSFHLEGGNVVSNRRHIFIGANAFEDNRHRFPDEGELFGEMSQLFGRTCVPIRARDGQVPWIHTDMYITPIDTRTVLVANPLEGCRLLPGYNTIPAVIRERTTEVAFNELEPGSKIQQRFDDVAQQLEGLGYEVIRVPALVNVEKDFMVTYNNVVLDYHHGQRVVYLPQYNIPRLDNAAVQIYRALGFDVYPVDVSSIFHLGGTVRCLTNVTHRLPTDQRQQTGQTFGKLRVYEVDPLRQSSRVSRAYSPRELAPAAREQEFPGEFAPQRQ